MIVLDENFPESQRQLLESWGIHSQQVGHGVGRAGMNDGEVRTLLHELREPTLLTRDLGFYDRRNCHMGYCIVVLEVGRGQAASFGRRVLRHPELDTWAKRRGKIVRASPRSVHLWHLHGQTEEANEWPGARP